MERPHIRYLPNKGHHISFVSCYNDIKEKKFETDGLNPLYRVIDNKKESNSDSNSHVVNRVESNWNDLVSDMYRIKGIITVLYPTNYIPGLTRTKD